MPAAVPFFSVLPSSASTALSKKVVALPSLWILCAGKPKGLIDAFGFKEVEGSKGLYAGPTPAWRVWIVVISELPIVRATILLRLLGSPSVRRVARRELAALPEDAWERRVAVPWLVRLCFEVLTASQIRRFLTLSSWRSSGALARITDPLRAL